VVRENIFLSRVAGQADSFIYHPLFRDFLCKQLEEETTAPDRARMRLSLARYYASKESWELALQNFFEAGAEDGAAETLLAAQRQLLANGLTLTVSKYFPRFSDRTLSSHPQLYNLMGDMQVIEGNTIRADAMYQSAIVAARRLNDRSAEAAALAGLAHTAARDHNFKDAIRYAEEAGASPPLKDLISHFASRSVGVLPDESTLRITLAARVKNVIGAVRAFEGRYAEATDLMEEALRLAHEAGEARLVRTISHNLALPAYMEGDFPAALRYFSRSPISGPDGGRTHPDSVTLYLNRAAIHTARGEIEPAEQDVERASEVTEIFSLHGFLPRILEARGNIARERLDFDEAARLYNGALNEYRRVGADPVKTDLYYERALLELRRREYEEALELINLMLEDRRAFGRDIEEAIARQMRGRILVARGDARAISDADAGEPLLRRLHCNYYLAISCYLKSRALADRDSEGGRRALLEFLSLAERFDYSYFITCEESFHPSLAGLCELYSVSSEWLNRVLSGRGQGPGSRASNATDDYDETRGGGG
ncbi:MAG TPA: tetratricopeptide repeat protein, partial [Blastocatellia bacterium]|nr:tetratricopeptide repeat protein [Blastocatellia bacterium]